MNIIKVMHSKLGLLNYLDALYNICVYHEIHRRFFVSAPIAVMLLLIV